MDIQLKVGNVDEGVQMPSQLNTGHIIELYLLHFTFWSNTISPVWTMKLR